MTKLDCFKCGEEVAEVNFDNLGEEVTCPNCKSEFCISWDESWEGENEYGWFYLESFE